MKQSIQLILDYQILLSVLTNIDCIVEVE